LAKCLSGCSRLATKMPLQAVQKWACFASAAIFGRRRIAPNFRPGSQGAVTDAAAWGGRKFEKAAALINHQFIARNYGVADSCSQWHRDGIAQHGILTVSLHRNALVLIRR
jgi:hypothetical protein